MIEVVNKYSNDPDVGVNFYIGRGSPLGNPFTGSKKVENTKAKFQCASREEAIESYEEWLRGEILNRTPSITTELNNIFKAAVKGNIKLVCFCKPKACHGDIIKKIIEEKI